jgi:hypothetical protein
VTNDAKEVVRLILPRDGQTFEANDDIWLEAEVLPSQSVETVRFLSDGISVGEASAKPYRMQLPKCGYGSFLIRAVVVTPDKLKIDSVPAYIHIAAPAGSDRELSASEMDTLMRGTDNPVVTLRTPRSGVSFTTPADLKIAADVHLSNSEIRQVTILADGHVLATFTQSPYEFTWKAVVPGRHTVVVRAEDLEGRLGTATAVVEGQQ